MTSEWLVILSLISTFPSIDANTSLCNKGCPLENMRAKSPPHALHHHPHLKLIHGILNIVGWGMLLPIGVITARYYRNLPGKCNEWYSIHILCQTSGFFLGSFGWGLGIHLRNVSKQHTILNTHGILGTTIFTFAAVQVFAIFLRPKEEKKCYKCWKIYHHLLGYALIALIIANIFLGTENQSPPDKWRWSYVGILAVLASVALPFEIFRCIKFINHQSLVCK